MLLDRLERRLHAQGIEVEFTEAAVAFLAREGFDAQFGARPLRRTIQRLVENELSRLVLGGALNPGDRLVVAERNGRIEFDVESGAATLREQQQEEVGAATS